MHVYEVRSRKDKRGFDLISDALPFQAVIWLVCARGVATARRPRDSALGGHARVCSDYCARNSRIRRRSSSSLMRLNSFVPSVLIVS
jgi:hypothetical protein